MTPTYLTPPAHFTLDEFAHYLDSVSFANWKPAFPTLHNTGVPSLAQWLGYGPTPQERWGANLNRYYAGMGWHAGPHLIVCPDYIWALCRLDEPGVSVSCWNSVTLGIEMVGNYEVGGDEFDVGEGARVRDLTVRLLALLERKFGWSLANFSPGRGGLHFHRECVQDHHACPGSRVSKGDVLARIAAAAAGLPAPVAPPAPPPAAVTPYAAGTVKDIQARLNAAGAHPLLSVDGVGGPATSAAIRAFQAAHDLDVDGLVGPETYAALAAVS